MIFSRYRVKRVCDVKNIQVEQKSLPRRSCSTSRAIIKEETIVTNLRKNSSVSARCAVRGARVRGCAVRGVRCAARGARCAGRVARFAERGVVCKAILLWVLLLGWLAGSMAGVVYKRVIPPQVFAEK